MYEESLTIPARDGYPLGAILARPAAEPQGAIVLNSATGVPKEFYRRFARYAAERGYAALLYDYRGVGGSRPPSLRGFAATMRAWGEQDLPGALAWLHAQHPGLPLYAVGHSVGGQLLGLMPNHHLLSAAALVSVSTGYVGGMPLWYGAYALAMFLLVMPLCTATLGYFPGGRLGFGTDLPAGVAHEWGAWCMHPRHLAPFLGTTIARSFYDELRAPLLWLSFSDDPIVTPRNTRLIQQRYSAATIESRRISPAELGLPAIGHLGLFREPGRARLWPLLIDWLAAHRPRPAPQPQRPPPRA